MIIKTLAQIAQIAESSIVAAYPIGSKIYGTNDEKSDSDFLIVSSVKNQKQDLISEPDTNIIIHSVNSWGDSLYKPSILALECIFLPRHQKIKEELKWVCNIKPKDVYKVASEKSLNDWKKAKNKFEYGDIEAGKKKIFHSIRLLEFAGQIIEDKIIYSYDISNHYWFDLYTDPSIIWEHYQELFGKYRTDIEHSILCLAKDI